MPVHQFDPQEDNYLGVHDFARFWSLNGCNDRIAIQPHFLVFAVAQEKAGVLVLWLRFRFCRLKLRIAELPEHKSEYIR